ncbi:MAG: hypothetical protein U9O24_10000 [Campylobacterota bacterium]|nr:hypothetical protein [Campylobacterota bacterium]
MIKPNPFRYKCPKCDYSKTIRPKSDVLDPRDFMNTCPKCGTTMDKISLNEIEKFLGKIFKF